MIDTRCVALGIFLAVIEAEINSYFDVNLLLLMKILVQ